MNRLIPMAILTVVLLGTYMSMAATNSGPSPQEAGLSGKAVIVEREGWYIGVKQNVRIETVGTKDFIVVPMTQDDSKTYDYWMPLDEIVGLKVFDKLNDAQAHDKRSSTYAKKPSGDSATSNDATSVDK
ncbi:MAG: hypothetical protein KDB27_12965 [Planctomycetales bacterium]|nr:hypothetical protein [Planctomycetales bacterium]